MRLGFAVKVLGAGGLPSHDTRRWQSEPHLRVSLEFLRGIFTYLDDQDIRMYRMTASLAPYETHPELTQFRGQVEECRDELAVLGDLSRELDLRLSTHPGQYVVLNSEHPDVQQAAIRDLELQASMFDAMGLGPEAIVNIHVGGAAGGLRAGADRFKRGFEQLSEAARRRITIENDDRTYPLCDVVALARDLGRPVCWDILHHHCNDPEDIPDREALELALSTWPDGVRPKIHYSSPRTDVGEKKKKVGRKTVTEIVLPQLRAHADLIDPIAFEAFLKGPAAGLDFDVMLEAKAKDLALLRLRAQLAERGLTPERPLATT